MSRLAPARFRSGRRGPHRRSAQMPLGPPARPVERETATAPERTGTPTLGARLDLTWRSLAAAGRAECPACGGEMAFTGGAGHCEACGSSMG